MQNQIESAVGACGSLRELAIATARYYESLREHIEAARIGYEIALTHFNSARAEDAPAEKQ